MLQDLTVEHTDPELIALAVRQVVDWGGVLDGYFICPTPPVAPKDEFPSHTVACYRDYHRQPLIDATHPLSGHIATIGACQCLGRDAVHPRFAGKQELSAAVLELLRVADPEPFLRAIGHDGPFHGTDATIVAGYRLHYCSWLYRGFWLSFRHIYIGK